MNRILITGVAGFIGANLARVLIKDENNFIIGVDNFSSSDISSLYSLLRNERFQFIENDISEVSLPYADKLFHCCGCSNFKYYFDNKNEFIKTQLDSLYKILEYTKINSSKTVIISDFINNNRANKNLKIYFDFIKLYGSLILEYVSKYNIKAKLTKISTIFGFNINKNNLQTIEKMIFKMLSNENFSLNYNIEDYYIYIDDVIKALIFIMDSDIEDIIIDIASKNKTKLSDIVNILKEYISLNSSITFENNETIHCTYVPNAKGYLVDSDIEKELIQTVELYKKAFFL